ncbi:MAG: DUF975 family protein [Candidatus Limivivens sp.]|nr:DUF975 family protein [Candidatus Limivivens sp.]
MMWTRYELKQRSKELLRKCYWAAVAVCLIAGILGGSYSSGGSSSENGKTEIRVVTPETDHGDYSGPVRRAVSALVGSVTGLIFLTMGMIVAVIGLLVKILVGNPMEVGKQYFFLKAQIGRPSVGDLLYAFRNGRYGNVVITTFLQKIKIFLWSLLLVVPGIVKSYEYYLVPYILAENPELEQSRIFELSREMMDGQKMEAFLLDLSFLPWMLLGAVTCNLSNVLWTAPYMAGTKAELYAVLRMDAIQRGITNTYELPGCF